MYSENLFIIAGTICIVSLLVFVYSISNSTDETNKYMFDACVKSNHTWLSTPNGGTCLVKE
jgi:hypothetical protein